METTTIGAAACFVWRWSNSRKGRRNTRYRLETDCCLRGIVNFAGEGYYIRTQEFASRMGNAADRTASTELNWKNTSRAYLNRFLGKYRNTGEQQQHVPRGDDCVRRDRENLANDGVASTAQEVLQYRRHRNSGSLAARSLRRRRRGRRQGRRGLHQEDYQGSTEDERPQQRQTPCERIGSKGRGSSSG